VTKRRSFETINYMLRPNKNVERKLIADTLQFLRSKFPISGYRYIGLGSIWFADFFLMHRHLSISDLITIEKETSRAKRIKFNRPFRCIGVRMEDAANALPKVIGKRKPSILWLDYDGYLEKALTGDIETAIGRLATGSFLLVTVNAEIDQLLNRRIEGDVVPPEDFLAAIAGDPLLKQQSAQLTRNDFPPLAAKILIDRLVAAALRSRPELEFVPIWNFRYADGATMITVGGMIGNEADRKKYLDSGVRALEFVTAPDQFEIDVPTLTEREKRAFDQLLPSKAAIKASSLPFELRDSEVAAYKKYYLYYPIFGEMAH
jgi:Putative O-methyltransferase